MAAVLDASPAYLEVKTFTGNYDSFVFTLNRDISVGYSFTITVFDAANKPLFTNNGVISGQFAVIFTISASQNLLVGADATFVVHWNNSGLPRAICSGPFTVGFP